MSFPPRWHAINGCKGESLHGLWTVPWDHEPERSGTSAELEIVSRNGAALTLGDAQLSKARLHLEVRPSASRVECELEDPRSLVCGNPRRPRIWWFGLCCPGRNLCRDL
jgi:hypothetical protein